MKKAKKDMLCMLVLMVISAAFYFIFIPSEVRVASSGNSPFNSRTFPNLLMTAMFIVSFIGFCKALFEYRSIKEKAGKEEGRLSTAEAHGGKAQGTGTGQPRPAVIMQEVRPYLAFVLILIYGLLFKRLGFIASTFIFVTAFLILLRCRNWKYYVACYGFSLFMYFIFTRVLHIVLP